MSSSLCDNELSSSLRHLASKRPDSPAEETQLWPDSEVFGIDRWLSVLNIAIGIVRTKAMAMLLGPAGFGLAGLYSSIADLTQSIAGMGINSSGVRQIAEAVGSDDTERIALTAAVLRRTSIVLGALGAVLLMVFSRQVSTITFGSLSTPLQYLCFQLWCSSVWCPPAKEH